MTLLFAGCSGASSNSSQPSSDSNGGSNSAKNQAGGDKGSKAGSGGNSGGQNSAAGGNGSAQGGAGGGDRMGGTSTFQVTHEQQARAGIRVALINGTEVAQTVQAPAQIAVDEERTAHIDPLVEGRVVEIYARVGENVRAGQVLAELHSHVIHDTIGVIEQDMADIARRQAAVSFETERAQRYAHLYSIQAASLEESQRAQQSLLQAKNDLAVSEVSLHTEREHLADVLQVSPSSLTPETLGHIENAPIRAAISGTVVSRSITPGMVFQPGMEAFTVSDLNTVWAIASLNEADLAHVRRGDKVTLQTAAWPGQVFTGSVALVGSLLDPNTRTVQVRIALPNREGQLKPAMLATAAISGGSTRKAVFVPEDAVQNVNGLEAVFVTEDGTTFRAQTVTVGPPVAHLVEVLEGVAPGAHVAVAGAFMLKSELLKSSLAGGG